VKAHPKRPSWNIWNPTSPLQTVILVCLVAALSYFAPRLEGALILHPQTVWPLWPGCALLVSLLLLVPRRIWLVVIPVAFASFLLYDLQAGVSLRSIVWFIAADTVQVLIAALFLSYFFDGVPRLNGVNALAKYLLFAVIVAPSTAAFISARGIQSNYWDGWKTCFFSEALAFLTLTPAILSWVSHGRAWLRKSRVYHLEAAALLIGLALLSYYCFAASATNSSPALLYSLVPLLLWCVLRFGSVGISSAVIVVAVLSIWGAVHGRGPFIEGGRLNNVFSIQLFLIFTATPFMVLAALVEERVTAGEALKKSEERLRLAVQAGRMYAFEWDAETDVIVRSGECKAIFDWMDDPTRDTGRQFINTVHPDDREAYAAVEKGLTPDNPLYHTCYRVLRPDGTVIWLEARGHLVFDDRARMLRIIGMVTDVTARRKAEEAVLQREKELLEAQRVAQVGSWRWDQKTDVVAWSKELYRIAGRDPNLPPPTYREQTQLYTAESWEHLKCAVAEALRTGAPYELDLQMIRPDGSTRWITDRGEALRDAAGQIAWLRGTAQDITERKQGEDALRASEEKFRSVFRDAGVGMVIVSPEGHFLAANEAFCECLGYTEEELLQKTVQSITLAEDWPSFSRKLTETLERGTNFQRVEKHCLHKSGHVITTESSASLIRGPRGEPRYFVGEVLDVTQRKLAEEALSSVSRRLIEAHEEERTWIARELHDDINQRIALLASNLANAKKGLSSSSTASRGIEEARQQLVDLGNDIQALSHRLHSSKLEYLGLVAAAAGFCRELSDRQRIEVDFHSEDIPKTLPGEISLCLFRVLQEALLNAIKHSGTQRFEVSLTNALNEIRLSVHDSGVGFDSEQAIKGRGLGLASMKERLKLVDGHLSIDSRLQGGTTIHASVPLNPRMKSATAGG
jgi:PAS domain S-box-containing protein